MNLARLKNNLPLFVFIIIFGLIVGGAVRVTLQMNNHTRNTEAAIRKVRKWHRQISLEIPAAQKQSWNNLGYEYPMQLLTSCAAEKKITP